MNVAVCGPALRPQTMSRDGVHLVVVRHIDDPQVAPHPDRGRLQPAARSPATNGVN